MTTFTGNRKQEDKILEMGQVAHKMVPEIELIAFKGIFRYGIQNALTKQGLSGWREVAAESPDVRKQFFENVLTGSMDKLLGAGLTTKTINALFTELRELNENYTR